MCNSDTSDRIIGYIRTDFKLFNQSYLDGVAAVIEQKGLKLRRCC